MDSREDALLPGHSEDRMPKGEVGDDVSLEDVVAFADNPKPRCACLLLLDTSKSISIPTLPIEQLGKKLDIVDGVQTYARVGTGEVLVPIEELNAAIKEFRDAIESDPLASLRVETAIVSFNDDVRLEQDFATVDAFTPPSLSAKGETSTATAVNFALDVVEKRKHVYRDAGVAYYRPWVVMITDDASTESGEQMMVASQRVHRAEESKQLAFFCVGVEGADMEELNRMGPRAALPMDGLAFKESDGAGGIVEVTRKFPVWLQPTASYGTPMCEALSAASKAIQDWTEEHPSSYPPMVISVTDGAAGDGNPVPLAEEIMALGTNDGNVLIYNAHLSEMSAMPVQYPSDESEVPPDEYAVQMFRMSSEFPDPVVDLAASMGLPVTKGSRGYVYNADMIALVQFLDIGTRAASDLH